MLALYSRKMCITLRTSAKQFSFREINTYAPSGVYHIPLAMISKDIRTHGSYTVPRIFLYSPRWVFLYFHTTMKTKNHVSHCLKVTTVQELQSEESSLPSLFAKDAVLYFNDVRIEGRLCWSINIGALLLTYVDKEQYLYYVVRKVKIF